MFSLSFVLELLTGRRPAADLPAVRSVVIDSRLARPGSLFLAFAGERADGHDFVQDAFNRGALAAVIERPVAGDFTVIDTRSAMAGDGPMVAGKLCLLVNSTLETLQTLARAWRSRFNARVVGVTGSVGKTSTKELTDSVLSQRYSTLKSEGNYNNEIGLPLTLLNLEPRHRRVVLEMGMYAQGEIALLCDIARPQVGVVTNVGPVHLERLGTLEAIVAAKQELVESLPPAPEGVAVLNRDEPLVMGMAAYTKARVFTYGLSQNADLRADNIKSMGLEGIRFSLYYGQEALSLHVPLLGRHSVHTALRAAAVGLVEGLSWEEIVRGLRGVGAQLRLVAATGPKGSTIIDDTYNSSPESAIAALNLLADLGGRRIAVLGDMLELGAAEDASHRLVGRRAADVADILVVVGLHGRLIGEEALAVGIPSHRVHFASDADAAAGLLNDMIEAGDIILVKASHGARLDRVVAALGRNE